MVYIYRWMLWLYSGCSRLDEGVLSKYHMHGAAPGGPGSFNFRFRFVRFLRFSFASSHCKSQYVCHDTRLISHRASSLIFIPFYLHCCISANHPRPRYRIFPANKKKKKTKRQKKVTWSPRTRYWPPCQNHHLLCLLPGEYLLRLHCFRYSLAF